jgi:hypothetical protein
MPSPSISGGRVGIFSRVACRKGIKGIPQYARPVSKDGAARAYTKIASAAPKRRGRALAYRRIALRPTDQDGCFDVMFCAHKVEALDQRPAAP